uniref:RING-type E3 ubiquitin transferase n=1 Tax=Spodoptera frugiperda TaxID=7108 RepID=A0A2H1WKV7_SPOFR
MIVSENQDNILVHFLTDVPTMSSPALEDTDPPTPEPVASPTPEPVVRPPSQPSDSPWPLFDDDEDAPFIPQPTAREFNAIVTRARHSLRHVEPSEDSNTASSVSEESNHSLPALAWNNNDQVEPEEPPAKVRKLHSPQEEIDGETCPICLDIWGNSGQHRLVALKCGHLFGAECVERWLKAQPAKDKTCPTCKSKASLKDLRFIYARKLIAADTTQITSLQKQVDILQTEKSRTELELQKTKIAHRACAAELETLKNSLLKSQSMKELISKRTWRYALEKNLEVCKDGGCRVLTYNCRTYELYVSQKSINYLFPGYGIRKVNCLDYSLGQFVHLHPKPIRDMSYSQPRDLLLSVGLDSTARIVDRGIPSATVNTGFPLWSCAWDCSNTSEFYVGGVGGIVNLYDFRNMSSCLGTIASNKDMSPVVSLCSTPYGLLSCQLNKCWLCIPRDGIWKQKAMPVEGSFMSMSYDSETQRALVSVRPSSLGTERSKLVVCKFSEGLTDKVMIDVEETFSGSARASLMSRSTFCKAPGASWVAAHSESESALFLHGLDGARTMSLPAAEPALDVCSLYLNGNSILAALSESRLRMYRAVQTSV